MRGLGWTGLAAAVGLAAGAALTASWLGPREPRPRPAPPPPAAAPDLDLQRRVETLSAALEAERSARQALADELAALRAQLDESSASTETASAAGPEVGEKAQTADDESDGTRFDGAALRDLRVSEADIDRLRERFGAMVLDELYLRNRATREGWLNDARFFEEMSDLHLDVRGDLGDDDYDRLLYAAGRDNRVIAAGVFPDSPAAHAGIRRGDAIVSYGGERIFAPHELQRATAEGEAGAWTEVWVRGKQGERRLLVPRGPLGILLEAGRRAPGSS